MPPTSSGGQHGAINEAWVAHPWIGAELLFDLDAMLPTVAPVVNIGEPLDAARGELIEGQASGKGVAAAMELIEVVVVPPHRRLDHGRAAA